MKQIRQLLILILLSFLVVGCATTKEMVSGSRYQSPLKNFTIALPNWVGLKIQDQNDKDGGRVSFHGDFGNLWAITYLQLPANSEAVFKQSEERDTIYRSFLKNYAFPSLFRQVSKGARIVHEEFLGEGENRGYFAVVSIPEGSAMLDLKQNKRFDSVRGLIIFEKHGFIYMVKNEMNNIFRKVDPSSLAPKLLESSQSILRQIKDSMVFKKR